MLSSTLALILLAAPAGATHDVAYWKAIAANDYAVPEGESPGSLLLELSGLLSSTDPELRDDLGYGIPARWIYGQGLLSPEELRALRELWSGSLGEGIGATGDDSVLLRSFSALNLALLAAYDNKSPHLSRDEFAALLDAALVYLAAEQDVRGWLPEKGWHHSVAHTADLLKFLGRSRHLAVAEQKRILDAIAAKMEAPGGVVYAWGEDERLARAVLSLIAREDFDPEAFGTWLDGLNALAKPLWEGPLDPLRFAAVQNARNLLRSLFVLLSGVEEPTEAQSSARTRVLEALRRM